MKAIVTTTINPPTEALIEFSKIDGWDLIIAGDLKTPHDKYFGDKRWFYLSPDLQVVRHEKLSQIVGWNCIQRRAFAILEAYTMGAELIALVDDDNVPLPNWGKEIYLGKPCVLNSHSNQGTVVDPLSVAGYKSVWHRGFPIDRIKERHLGNSVEYNVKCTPQVQANFWNGELDVDAICRLTHNTFYKVGPPFEPFTCKGFSPFNSQNTILTREAVKNYFLFPGVGRYDDILASYILEHYYAHNGNAHSVVYAEPTVFQNRNQHNIYDDLYKELWGYRNISEILKEMDRCDDPYGFMGYIPEQARDFVVEWNKIMEAI